MAAATISAVVVISDERRSLGWVSLLDDLGLTWGSESLILGEGAEELGRRLSSDGALSASYSRPDCVVLGTVKAAHSHPTPLDTGLPGESLGLVVMRHAVEGQDHLARALEEAHRILRPGSGLMVADVNPEAMLDGTFLRYPVRLLYDLYPEVLGAEIRRHIDRADQDVEVVRAGFKAVHAYDVDEEVAVFESVDNFLSYVERGGWRSDDLLNEEQRAVVIEALRGVLAARFGGADTIVDRETWHITRGSNPEG